MTCEIHRTVMRLVAALPLLATGCLYHAGKDALARSALADFKDAHISASLDDELAHSKDMLQSELTATRRELEARRDEALARVLDLLWDGPASAGATACAKPNDAVAGDTFQCEINTLLNDVAGTPGVGPSAKALQSQLEDATLAEGIAVNEIAADERSFPLLLPPADVKRLSCPTTGDPDPEVAKAHPNPKLLKLLDGYTQSCRILQAARAKLASFGEDSRLGAVTKRWQEEKANVDAQHAAAAAQAKQYDAARLAYAQAVQERTALRTKVSEGDQKLAQANEKVGKAADAARSALDRLGQPAGGAAGIKNVFALEESLRARYSGVVDAIGRIAEGKPKAESGLEVVLGAALRIEEIKGGTGLPRLLLEAERLCGQLAMTRIVVDHANRRVALLDAERSGRFEQFTSLMEAAKGLERARSACKGGEGLRVHDRFKAAADSACKETIAGVLVAYANAYTTGELKARLAQARLLGDYHDQGIEISAAALSMWENALGVPMNGVVDEYGSGIRPEELAKLAVGAVGAGALVGIAVK